MVSEPQNADELKEVGDDHEGGVRRLGSTARPRGDAGLDPKMSADPRGLVGDDLIPQKDCQLEFRLKAMEERLTLATQRAEDKMSDRMEASMREMKEQLGDHLEGMMEDMMEKMS